MASIIPHVMKDLPLSTAVLKKPSEGHKAPLNITKSSQQSKLPAQGLLSPNIWEAQEQITAPDLKNTWHGTLS